MTVSPARRWIASAAVLAAVGGLGVTAGPSAFGVVRPGTPGPDVHLGLDNDNVDNPFIQPPGVAVRQDMDDTDVLFGRDSADLLVGNRGGDTLLGGSGPDILVGGPDRGGPSSADVEVGDTGRDIAIWAPGDGNDAFVGNEGYDTMIFGPVLTTPSGDLRIVRRDGRKVPRVDLGSAPRFGCTIVTVPLAEDLGFQHLVRFEVDGEPVATVRQKEVERVLCPGATAGVARVADLRKAHPRFHDVALSDIPGVTGNIVAPVG